MLPQDWVDVLHFSSQNGLPTITLSFPMLLILAEVSFFANTFGYVGMRRLQLVC